MSFVLLILAGVVVSMVVGMSWYAPTTPMGKIHFRYLGMDKLSPEERENKMREAKPMMPKMYAAQTVLSLLLSSAVVLIITMSMHNGVSFTMALGFVVLNWLCFMVPVVGTGILWSNCDRAIAWQKFFSDSLENLVTMVLIAVLTSLFV